MSLTRRYLHQQVAKADQTVQENHATRAERPHLIFVACDYYRF